MTDTQIEKIKNCVNLLMNGRCDNKYLTEENAIEILKDYADTLDGKDRRDLFNFLVESICKVTKRYRNAVSKYKEITEENIRLQATLELYRKARK